MKIAIMGAGAVGGYFGARLANAGADVAFIARGQHLLRMREYGLKLEGPLGDLEVKPVRVTDRPAEIGPVDIVLFAVKLWDTEASGEACRPLLGEETAVVSFQNGVDSAERLVPILGVSHVAGGVAHIAATIAAPGVIRQTGTMARLTFGELDGTMSPRLQVLEQRCRAAGIDAHLVADINRVIWEKFAFLAPLSGVASLTRAAKGMLLSDPDTRAFYRDAIAEVVAVARAKGVALPLETPDSILRFTDGLPAETKPSMLKDLERGGRLEVEWLSGAVARLGVELGVATPIHRFIRTALKLQASGARPV